MLVEDARVRVGALLALASALSIAPFTSGCAPRARMCGPAASCPAQSTCVAGRCQVDAANVHASVESARRLVVPPVEMAYVHPGDDGAGVPDVVRLGRGASLYLRFEVPLPDDARIVEAYLVLTRAEAEDDPEPISLHATRIVEAWSARSTSWTRRPRTEDLGMPATHARPSGPGLVRVEIAALVRAWKRRDALDHGLSVVSDGGGARGMAFATSTVMREGDHEARAAEPYLELYVR